MMGGCCCSVAQLFLTLCDPMDCRMPGFPVLYHLRELSQTHVHWVGNAIQPSHLLSPPSPAFSLSQHQGLFQWVGSSIRWPNYWSFSFSISFSSEYSGLISFKIGCFDLLGVQGSLRSLLQHHNSEASILWCLAFLMVQLPHPHMITTGKAIALIILTFVGKVMFLLLNTLSGFVIAYFPRSNHLIQ